MKGFDKVNNLVPIDPINDSTEHLMVIAFAKSKSPVYPLAVNVAQGAFKYAETEIGKQIVHFALLSKSKEGANRALTLFKYLENLKTFQIFCKGRLIGDFYKTSQILQCYLLSCDCNDYKAHCHLVIDDPFEKNDRDSVSLTIRLSLEPQNSKQPITKDQYIFPCNYLRPYFKFQHGHPAKIEDQIQAIAVKEQCDWCPQFNPSDFKKLHTKIIMPDGKIIYHKADE